MNFAWYGHLKFKNKPLFIVILISWGIAFFEYCLQVPANRYGRGILSAPQLKILQEVITFVVFTILSIFYLREKPSTYDLIAFLLVVIAVCVSVLQPKV